jgi:glutathione S-transferase
MSINNTSIKALRLLGVPLSQPFNSCAWTMLQLNIPFQIEIAVPGNTSSKIGTRHENFQSLTKHRSTQVPILIDNNNNNGNSNENENENFVLTESAAILTYLCERYGSCDNNDSKNNNDDNDDGPKLYALPGTQRKAMIDSYMHWHHTNTRFVSKLFGGKIKPEWKNNLSTDETKFIQNVMTSIDTGWLQQQQSESQSEPTTTTCYIGGFNKPSIADILAYGELSTVTMTNLLDIDENKFNNLSSWMDRMSNLPYHDEAHIALSTLGDLSIHNATTEEDNTKDGISSSSNNDTILPIAKRLGAATKAGMASYENAQNKYTNLKT